MLRDQCATDARGSLVSFVKTAISVTAFIFFLRQLKAIEGTKKKYVGEVSRAARRNPLEDDLHKVYKYEA